MCLILGGCILAVLVAGTIAVLLHVSGRFDRDELFDCGYGVEDSAKGRTDRGMGP